MKIMHPFLISLLKIIYPIPESNLTRDRRLEVLALGISRSGTESLRQALFELGYSDVHHGFRFILEAREATQWLRLAHAQQTGDKTSLKAKDFDRVLGNCAALTDQPSCGFAHDLIAAYPGAKIILNYREDVEAWHKSVASTVETFNASWYDYILTFFEAEMFWQQRCFYELWRRCFGGDFEANGRKWYREHYAGLEKRLSREGREFLKWKVEDGWEPLSKFLGKAAPSRPFPSGNTPKDYEMRMGELYLKRRARAERSLRISVGGLVVAVAGGLAYYASYFR